LTLVRLKHLGHRQALVAVAVGLATQAPAELAEQAVAVAATFRAMQQAVLQTQAAAAAALAVGFRPAIKAAPAAPV
jgi:hypothetical protein